MISWLLAFATALAAASAQRPLHQPQHAHHGGSRGSASAGCGINHSSGYNYQTSPGHNFSIVSDNISRYYSVQVPDGYVASKAYPLIFDYHGNTDTASDQHNNSAYFNYTQDYLVVYPQGLNRHWEGPSYAVKGINDTLFTTDLLDHIKTDYCIDPSRVYASGKSNGGGFVDLLACSDAGDEFAAFAMASAALYNDTSLDICTKRRAIMESHGNIDTVISPYGGPGSGGDLPDILEWVSWWGQRDCGADATPVYDTTPAGYNITTYSCGDWDDVVVHYQLYNLGHCWPSSTGTNFDALHISETQNCTGDRDLAYTPVVLDFFSKWTLESAPHNKESW
ncbi:hypothetical protein LTR78_006807 [Recurvomyces mirabilis]|uniref:feruloyl esterase n=1 Tax=Recurvomyces mirabilis TaxID=574656 RepID=A0AAE0WK96_9PEZI|nr:hypothetical protein LTR78_006807 [Recurvomyces mirabilis]KAK5153203.1 hypothetical protein LTS14_007848 [Recurvomyces mirabilis]